MRVDSSLRRLIADSCIENILFNSELQSKYRSRFFFLPGLMQAVQGYTQVYSKERIYRLWIGPEPWVILWKPESVESILSNNFLLQKSTQYDFLHPWLGTGLLTSAGQKWRSRRKMLVPAFHFKILHDFVPVFNEQADVLIRKISALMSRNEKDSLTTDVVPLITACALDIICGEFCLK